MTPDIHFSKGQPAKEAYNYIVRGAKDLAKQNWIYENIGIQVQSWGGIKVEQLITKFQMFKAFGYKKV